MQIHLLHVNDVHSQLESYMRLGWQLRSLRSSLQAAGHVVLTFDLGDLLDRVRPETEASMGVINADMCAKLGVDGWVFGNNEGLTIPVADWPILAERAHTIVFGTNLKQSTNVPFHFFHDYHIYEVQGVRVGVFGVTPNYRLPYDMLKVHAEDPYQRAQDIVARLQAEDCDIVVCLSHLGLNADHAMANQVDGIDVILGGHTHQFMKAAEWTRGTAIFQPGKHARVFGHTTLTLDASRRVTDVVSRAVPVHLDTPYDEAMLAAYEAHMPQVQSVLHRQAAALPERLPVDYDDESVFANLLADVLYDEFPGDFSLMMTGALNASLLPGPIQLEHLLGACPTPTRPIVVGLKGSEIYDVLRQGIERETYARRGIGFGFRGGQIGYLVVSGATIVLSNGDDGELFVSEIRVQDQPIDPDTIYRVITCEYLWLSPVFAPFRQARDISYQPPLVREVLFARLHDEGRLARAKTRRYVRPGRRAEGERLQ
ncbi:bifunctional metallophosphatase/5'-nucleotidase [Alicyclobacillus dauci]|uniref:5'-nucleotidase C-terminal domain-containing protein n=1 Tax=Alicyclobacillus dauci TaxID=1475485 RepID=A0ABY6Z1H7_9BACL|nr:5'-nucleotidase C-terminal domain-containing protein [Alicyclobacillus dauci]WAH36579.1 5'-nucleotidase C-terminal domain-containing protein [Alicyclobacillus dauci]